MQQTLINDGIFVYISINDYFLIIYTKANSRDPILESFLHLGFKVQFGNTLRLGVIFLVNLRNKVLDVARKY